MVSLSAASSEIVSLDYATADGAAERRSTGSNNEVKVTVAIVTSRDQCLSVK